MPMSTKSCRAFIPSFVFPFTFSKVPTTLSQKIFNVHHVYIMSYLKFTPLWKIKEDWSFLPNVFLCGLLLLMFFEHNINVFHLIVYFFTIAGFRHNFILRTSIKCFFQSTIKMILRKEFFDVLYTQFFDHAFKLNNFKVVDSRVKLAHPRHNSSSESDLREPNKWAFQNFLPQHHIPSLLNDHPSIGLHNMFLMTS